MAEDHYRTLNVSPDATADEIQRAYRALARRYHPDRNPAPAAATLMAVINEAHKTLGEPNRRIEYDRKHRKQDERLDGTILFAAKDNLRKRGWAVVEEGASEFILKDGSRQVYVGLASRLTPSALRRVIQRHTGFCVVLAVRVESDIEVPPSIAVIDLMRSQLCAGEFPDPTYQDLFSIFL